MGALSRAIADPPLGKRIRKEKFADTPSTCLI